MVLEKPAIPSQRQKARRALQVAVAALQLLNSEAHAADQKKAAPKATWSTHVHSESPDSYVTLSKRMHGVHLEGTGATLRQWQYEEFCRALEKYCRKFENSRADIDYDHTFSPRLFRLLDVTNRRVNRNIRPISDILLHGVIDKWTMDDAGDCEEYVLHKMDELINAGLDPAYLHIMVVGDEKGEGHAVLGVDVFTNGQRDTLILDNLVNDIITLSEMEKKYEGRRASFLSHTGNRENLTVHFYEYRSAK